VAVQWKRVDVTEYEPPAEGFDLVVGHDRTNPTEGWGGPKDTAVLYGPDDVVADLDALDVVKAERARRPVPADEGEQTAIDVLVRAVRPRRRDEVQPSTTT
jgi:hypothetical protein